MHWRTVNMNKSNYSTEIGLMGVGEGVEKPEGYLYELLKVTVVSATDMSC